MTHTHKLLVVEMLPELICFYEGTFYHNEHTNHSVIIDREWDNLVRLAVGKLKDRNYISWHDELVKICCANGEFASNATPEQKMTAVQAVKGRE